MHWDIVELIRAVGYVGIFSIIFAESGLLFGVFLPGDSLLFTAGFLASQGLLSLPVLILGCVVAAVSGDAVGYIFGKRVGRRLYARDDSRWFRRKHLLAAEAFYQRHGGKAIIIARFVPIVRTFAPIVAGAANMRYRRFALFNVVGGFLWGLGLPAAGYILGSAIPDVDRYLLPIVAAIVIASVLPNVLHLTREFGGPAAIWRSLRNSRRLPNVAEIEEGA